MDMWETLFFSRLLAGRRLSKYKEYQDTEQNGFGPFSWNGTTEQGTICHACWNVTEKNGTVHGPERNGPERKWPYLDTIGLPEAND